MPKEKDQSIETLRGLAILLVVAGYIILDDLGLHGRTVFSSGLKFSYYCLKPIRMPLFTVISAYLYASFPATKETFKKLVSGKMRRILIPFAVVSAVQYAFYSIVPTHVPHPINEIYRIYLYPLDQFWFLYSIFWIFIIVGAMDAFKMLETPKKWFFWLAVALVSNAIFDPTRLFSINGVNYLLPFFLIGYGIRRFYAMLFTPRMIKSYLAVMAIAYVPYLLQYWRTPGDADALHKGTSLFISCTAVPLIFHYRKNIPFFARIGYYAFGIHIFNKISVAFPRAQFHFWHMENDAVIFITFLASSVIFSIGFQELMEKFSFTRKFVLGLKDNPPKTKPIEIIPAVPVRDEMTATLNTASKESVSAETAVFAAKVPAEA
jgi:hypothetical protein